MTIDQLRARLRTFLDQTDLWETTRLTEEHMTLSTLGDLLGNEFWLLLMYQVPSDPETLNRIAKALERIEKKMMPSY